MKSYLMRMNEPVGLQKVQIRDDVRQNKRPFPNHDHIRFDVPLAPDTASYLPPRFDSYNREDRQLYSIVFNVIRLTVAIWNEINRDGANSYGYHILICDFIEVPQGVSLVDVLEIPEYTSVTDHLNVQYYKDEIDVLRERVGQLELELKRKIKENEVDNSYLERMGIL